MELALQYPQDVHQFWEYIHRKKNIDDIRIAPRSQSYYLIIYSTNTNRIGRWPKSKTFRSLWFEYSNFEIVTQTEIDFHIRNRCFERRFERNRKKNM